MKNNKGITLIALVITIIILLILAGVALNLTIGENGIFRLAKYATEQYKNKAVEEQNMLAQADDYIDNSRSSGTIEKLTIAPGYTLYRDGKRRRLELSNVTFSNTDFVYLPLTSDYPKDYQIGTNFTPYNASPTCIVVDNTGKIYLMMYTVSSSITSSYSSSNIYGNVEWYVE